MLQLVLTVIIFMIIVIPIGNYLYHIASGQRTFADPVFDRVDGGIFKVCGIHPDKGMNWKQYALALLLTNAVMVFVGYLVLRIQFLPIFNPNGIGAMEETLSFNTIISFMTNTNLQHYSGESGLSYLSQMLVITYMMFVSAATGYAACIAFVRGLAGKSKDNVGNFYADLVKVTTRVLIPLSIIGGMLLIWQGVPQNFDPNVTVTTIEGTQQDIAMGPVAALEIIKHIGTNGGGFFGVNSAHPYENPSAFTNIIEMTSLLLIPAACCFAFGIGVKNTKQGKAIFAAMFILLVIFTGIIAVNEHAGTPQLADGGAVNIEMTDGQAGGNMEGKESRFGIASSSTWSAFTTAASNGSVNSMHDSYTPLGGFVQMLQIALGEVVFGGVGCGLYGMIGFAILTVFIAGLMVGRTPEFLGKKIEPGEMRWAVVLCLATPFAILVCSAIACMVPGLADQLNNGGAHGFSEALYAFTSCGGNNGSAFAGMNCNIPWINVMLGLEMLFARFMPIIGTLAIAGSLAKKGKVAESAGTLSTTNGMFVFLLVFIVLLIGALSFFPALALGPVAEFFQMIA